MRDKDGKTRGKKAQPKTKHSTPEQVAAYESMKNNHIIRTVPKPIKHTPKNQPQTKLSTDPTLTMNIFTLRQQPTPDAVLEQMAFRLVKWVTSEKRIIFDDFLEQEGKSLRQFNRYKARCSKLEEVYQFALMCVGNKRERDAYYNKGNPALVIKSMPSYSVRWKDLAEWTASLTTKDSDKPTQTVVIIDKAQETDIVKPLPKEDKHDKTIE